ncbi:MAG TPA: serine hydrolase, partial [Dehalococcoidia bacterium]|nr:serine hydrolase [Dehalococcoidia bacterium]
MPPLRPIILLLFVALVVSACSSESNAEPEGLSLTAAEATPTAIVAEATSTPATTVEATPEATATPGAVPEFPDVLLIGSEGVPALTVDPQLEQLINDYTGGASDVSVVVKHLVDGRGAVINAGQSYNTASLFKIFVMYEVFHQRDLGNLSFDEQLEVTQEWIDLSLGESVYTTPGQLVSIAGALEAMITVSDNVTANMLADRAGWENMRASVASLGLSSTQLQDGNRSTAADVARFFEVLYSGGGFSSEAANEMLNLLSLQQIRDRIPKYLPGGTQVA